MYYIMMSMYYIMIEWRHEEVADEDCAGNAPFELQVYESVLSSVLELQETELNKLKIQVDEALALFNAGDMLSLDVQVGAACSH